MCYLGKIKWTQSKPIKNTFGYQMVLSHEIQFIGFEIVLNLAESSLESLTSSRIWAGPEFAQPVRRQAVKGHRLSLWQKSTPPTTFQLVMGLHILNTLPPSWQFFFSGYSSQRPRGAATINGISCIQLSRCVLKTLLP